MTKLVIVDKKGNSYDGFVTDEQTTNKDVKTEIANDRRQNLKEHLYMGYLIVGTIAFTLGILISLRRLNGK